MCRHERWTHDAALFQAAAAAVALLEVADERAVLERKREHRLEWKLDRAREIFAQMIVDPARVAASLCLPRRSDAKAGRGARRAIPDTATQRRGYRRKFYPGLKIFFGSNARLIWRITPSSSSPSCSRMYSVRAMPTPCSAESEPLNCLTRAEV